jgi:malonyl-CoA O-methyltransferase
VNERRQRIAARFGRADEYDAHSDVQREAATRLAARVAELPLPAGPRVLEIGCGTGHLSERLAERLPSGRFLFTDLAPEMVARCRARVAGGRLAAGFAAMDGEAPAAREGAFDLVASAMTFQWFEDLASSLARLFRRLARGGHIAFATLGSETFREWRAAHAAVGASSGAIAFPSAEEVRASTAAAANAGLDAVRLERVECISHHPDAQSFLRGLRAIGATVPHAGHEPLAYTSLRSVMRQLESASADGVRVTYELVIASIQKEPLP